MGSAKADLLRIYDEIAKDSVKRLAFHALAGLDDGRIYGEAERKGAVELLRSAAERNPGAAADFKKAIRRIEGWATR